MIQKVKLKFGLRSRKNKNIRFWICQDRVRSYLKSLVSLKEKFDVKKKKKGLMSKKKRKSSFCPHRVANVKMGLEISYKAQNAKQKFIKPFLFPENI